MRACVRADAADGAPLQGFQRTNFAVARAAAAALLGELDDAAVLRAASAVDVPGRFEVVGRGAADDLRRRPQPERHRRARVGAARGRRRPAR